MRNFIAKKAAKLQKVFSFKKLSALFCSTIVYMKYVLPALLLLCFFSCKKPKDFEYREMKNFKIDSLGFDHSNVSMDLYYFNPNNFRVDLKKIDCDVYVEHNYVGRFTLDTTMHIAKRSEF